VFVSATIRLWLSSVIELSLTDFFVVIGVVHGGLVVAHVHPSVDLFLLEPRHLVDSPLLDLDDAVRADLLSVLIEIAMDNISVLVTVCLPGEGSLRMRGLIYFVSFLMTWTSSGSGRRRLNG
jgi:hypothetical protein